MAAFAQLCLVAVSLLLLGAAQAQLQGLQSVTSWLPALAASYTSLGVSAERSLVRDTRQGPPGSDWGV